MMILLIFLSRGWFTNPLKQTTQQIVVFGVVFFINDFLLGIEGKSTEVYIALSYIGLGAFALYSLRDQLQIHTQFLVNDTDIPAHSQKSLNLKIQMLKQLGLVIVCYVPLKILLYLYRAFNYYDQVGRTRFEFAVQFLDLIITAFLLFTYMPKKKWPFYFEMNIEQLQIAKQNEPLNQGVAQSENIMVNTVQPV